MIQTSDIFIPIPKARNTQTKIEINGDDLTARTIESIWVYPATLGVGTFRIVLSNANGQISELYKAGQFAKFYADNTDGTTLQFWGRIDYVKDNISTEGQFLEIEGRHRSFLLSEFLVCHSAIGVTTSQLLRDIIDKLPASYGFTYTNVEEDATTMDVNWNYKPFWDCIIEICNKAGGDGSKFDCYPDNDLDFHFFEQNTKVNETEYIAEGLNFLKAREWGTNDYFEKTRVIATGQDVEGLPIVYTAISPTEEEEIKEVFIKETSANTETKVQTVAEAKLAEITNRAPQARMEAYGLETLTPGENIWIVVPRQKIYGLYKIIQIMNKFGAKSGGWRTEVLLEEDESGVPQSIQQVNDKSVRAIETDNTNKRNFSWNFDFESDSGTHSSTQITDGVLKTDGSASGTWISPNITVDTNVTGVDMKTVGDSLAGTKIRLSVNGGITYTQIWGEGLKEIVPLGRNLRIRVDISSANTQIKSMALLYT